MKKGRGKGGCPQGPRVEGGTRGDRTTAGPGQSGVHDQEGEILEVRMRCGRESDGGRERADGSKDCSVRAQTACGVKSEELFSVLRRVYQTPTLVGGMVKWWNGGMME